MFCHYLFRNSNLLFSNAVNDCLKNIVVVEDFSGSVRVRQYPANLMVRVTKSEFGEIECVDVCVCAAHLGQCQYFNSVIRMGEPGLQLCSVVLHQADWAEGY